MAQIEPSPEQAKAAWAIARKIFNPVVKDMIQKQSILVANMEVAVFSAKRHLELVEGQLAEAKIHLGTLILEVDKSERADG